MWAGPVSSHQFCRGFWRKDIVIVTICFRRVRRLPVACYICALSNASTTPRLGTPSDPAVILPISPRLHLRSAQGGLTHHHGPPLAIIVQKRKREAPLWGWNSEMNCQNLSSSTARSQKLDALRGLDQLDDLGSEGGSRPACSLNKISDI